MNSDINFDKNGVNLSCDKRFTEAEIEPLKLKGYYFHGYQSANNRDILYVLAGRVPIKEIMNIKDLKTARDQLEEDLLHLIDAKVDAFKRETGVMVESIGVDFRRVSVQGGETSSFVNGVRVGMML